MVLIILMAPINQIKKHKKSAVITVLWERQPAAQLRIPHYELRIFSSQSKHCIFAPPAVYFAHGRRAANTAFTVRRLSNLYRRQYRCVI